MANKERIRTITLRKFYLLLGNYSGSIKSHKIHDQFLLLDFSINKGEIEIKVEKKVINAIVIVNVPLLDMILWVKIK